MDDPAAQAVAEFRWIRKPSPAGAGGIEQGTLNVAYNALDRHVVEGRGDQDALICAGPASPYSYASLLDRVAKCAGALRLLGAGKGGAVVARVAETAEAVIVMLACARIGALHLAVPMGGSPEELAGAVAAADPAVVVAQPDGLEAALADTRRDPAVVVVRREKTAELSDASGRYDFHRLLRDGGIQPAEAVEIGAAEPMHALAGPGGAPGPAIPAADMVRLRWTMVHELGIGAGDAFSIMEHAGALGRPHVVYGPLLAGATLVLGDAPHDARIC